MSSDNHGIAAWEGIQGFTDSDYENLNLQEPEQPFMQMWAVAVCLTLIPISMPRGDFTEGSPELESRKTYVGWWKDMQMPLPIEDGHSDDELDQLHKRFSAFFGSERCRTILEKNAWVGKGVMKLFGAWTAHLTRFALETLNGAMSLYQSSDVTHCEDMRQCAAKLLRDLYPRLAFTAEQATELSMIWDHAMVQNTSGFLITRARAVKGPGRVAESCLSGICSAWNTHRSSLPPTTSLAPSTIDSRASKTSDSPTDVSNANALAVENHLARMSQTETKYWEMRMIETFHNYLARGLTASSYASGSELLSVAGPD